MKSFGDKPPINIYFITNSASQHAHHSVFIAAILGIEFIDGRKQSLKGVSVHQVSLFFRSWDFLVLDVFFFIQLSSPLDFIFVFHPHVMGGIPPPSRGIVGKNQSTQRVLFFPIASQSWNKPNQVKFFLRFKKMCLNQVLNLGLLSSWGKKAAAHISHI